jgi:enoyl-CoA hydratase/carnithine racemase
MLLVDIKDQVALVTLNRPDAMNALSRATTWW